MRFEAKRCTECSEVKPLHEFAGHKNSPDGLQFRCRVCVAKLKDGTARHYEAFQKARKQRRTAQIRTTHEPYSRDEIFHRWDKTCAYCDAPATVLDHVTPIAKSGCDAEWNLVPACTPCNGSKGAKTLAEWAATF